MTNKREKRGRRPERERDDFNQKIIDLARVTRVMAGGKRMRFRACVVVGDGKGNIGFGVAKGADVAMAVNKAVKQAKKSLIFIKINEGTIPHQIVTKYKAAKLVLKPAAAGTGIVAGGATRMVLELSGISNVSAKVLGSSNKINNVKATFQALESFVRERQIETKKDKTSALTVGQMEDNSEETPAPEKSKEVKK
ncbi:MAG: 30S ribosomal protein S5 [Candidatus Komeilibacteria bacterium]|nr:30S ribosomal protein S5 [Candidatus Komeilibacteria bacterium]